MTTPTVIETASYTLRLTAALEAAERIACNPAAFHAFEREAAQAEADDIRATLSNLKR